MRKYEPIWHKLKKEKQVSITANRLVHPRIIKAVIKEKYEDIAYKLAIEPARARISYTRNNSILTFYLTHKATYLTASDMEL
jgi:hypothetical protein